MPRLGKHNSAVEETVAVLLPGYNWHSGEAEWTLCRLCALAATPDTRKPLSCALHTYSVDTQAALWQKRASVLWQCNILVWLYRNHSVFEGEQWRRAGPQPALRWQGCHLKIQSQIISVLHCCTARDELAPEISSGNKLNTQKPTDMHRHCCCVFHFAIICFPI